MVLPPCALNTYEKGYDFKRAHLTNIKRGSFLSMSANGFFYALQFTLKTEKKYQIYNIY